MQQQTSTNSAVTFTLGLSEEEVRGLLEDKSPAILVDMTEKIAGAYAGETLQPYEIHAAEQVFRLLLRETELRVRVALSQQIKSSPRIPKDIVMTLARDVEEVSLPILQFSEVLSDGDLTELLSNTQEITRYIAVSKRGYLSDVISDTLIARGSDEITTSLLENPGAQISDNSLQKIVAQHPKNERIMNAMGKRPRLPVAVTEKLIHLVSSSLADTLRQKYKLPAAELDQEAEKTRENETLSMIRSVRAQEEIDKLVSQLQSFNRLTPSIILSALCQGNFGFFETALARMSAIPVANARTLISDRGELGFRAIYNKSGLPDAMFPAVKLLLNIVRELDVEGFKPGSAHYANRIVERILEHTETHPIDNASYIIALVRRTT